jgi:DNA-binding NarL/FixJ family response regulator
MLSYPLLYLIGGYCTLFALEKDVISQSLSKEKMVYSDNNDEKSRRSMIRIAIADDHELIRNGLGMLIDARSDMRVALEASCYRELIDSLSGSEVDLLILDLNLGDTNGLHTIEKIHEKFPSLPVLVLSAYPENLYALRAFKSGASGYLNKSAVSSELIDAITTIIRGKKYISRAFEEILPLGTEPGKEERNLGELLSKREFEVLNLIAAGHTPKEIAEVMGVSPKTVSTYRTRMMEKLSLETTTQLQRFAYETFSSENITQ